MVLSILASIGWYSLAGGSDLLGRDLLWEFISTNSFGVPDIGHRAWLFVCESDLLQGKRRCSPLTHLSLSLSGRR